MSSVGSKRVLTIGTFDLFHIGHMELFIECLALVQSGSLWVGVNSDDFVAVFKHAAPKVSLADRMAMVKAYLGDHGTVLPHWNQGYTPRLIEWLRPDIIAVGDDWQDRDYLGQLGVTQDWLDERGIEVVYIPRRTGVSSTALRP